MKWCWLALLLAWQGALAGDNPFPGIARAYLVQVNGATLWQQDAERRLPPASLTKLMTLLLVLERAPNDAEVDISREAARETGSRLGLGAHSRFSVEALLKATLLASANDACHALADHVAGTESRFVALMNARAGELGLKGTHFTNACGHDAARHYSTAADLAALARRLMDFGFIQSVARLADASIQSLDGKYRYHLTNHNALIGRYEGALGLKTGFTAKAGKCLVAYAERRAEAEDRRVLLVMLNAPNRWWDAVDVLDLAFAHEPVRQ